MTKSSLEIYKKLWPYMAEYKNKFFISIIAMIIAAGTEPAFARVLKLLIDGGFTQQNRKVIILIPVLIIIIFLIRGGASYVNETISTWLSSTIVEKMRRTMFNHMLRLPVSYYDNNNSGRILSKLIFDVNQIADAGFNIITVSIRDGFTVLGLLGLLFYTNWHLTLFCIFTLPLVLILVKILAKRLRRLNKNNQQHYGQMTQIITEAVQGQKIVKLFGGQDYERTRFIQSIAAIKENSVKQTATSSLNSGLSQFLIACSIASMLYFAASNNNFTAGGFVSFISAMFMIFAPIKRITSVTQSLQKGLTAADSVFEFLSEINEQDQGEKTFKFSNSIIFSNINFKYDLLEKDILTNIDLTINAGQTIALVGSSGSGKTTLANLIPRFYMPQNGKILIDGVNIQDFSLKSLRDNIALVSQDITLFNDSVANNIAYGVNATEEEIASAADFANATEFIKKLPQGFETYIGENGTRLSGGQKQRLAIARAILKNALILILDEATSALDNTSEKLVQEALDRLLMQQRTTLVIAHRLSTIINSDLIVVMDQGKIVETGTHQTLLEQNGTYKALHNLC